MNTLWALKAMKIISNEGNPKAEIAANRGSKILNLSFSTYIISTKSNYLRLNCMVAKLL